MQFFQSQWLNAFWIVSSIALLLIGANWRKRIALAKFGDRELVKGLIGSHSYTKEKAKQILIVLILIFITFSLAQPQWGNVKKEVKRKGVEVIFLIDTSLSMLAEDASPNRIEKAKLVMRSFLREVRGDRVGIVTFAGSGFIQSPLTLDYNAFLLFANSIEVGYIPDAGTSLSEAIQTAIRGFPDSTKKHHVIIMLSDGEHFEGDLDAAIKAAQEANARIYAIGVGTSEGQPIPLRSESGHVSGYKKDRNGQVVITKLNEPLLRRLGDETGGLFFPVTTGGREVAWIYKHMQNIEKQEFKQKIVTEREDHYQLFLGIAILLFIFELCINEVRKNVRTVIE